MKCPACTNVDLLMGERQGVEIVGSPGMNHVRFSTYTLLGALIWCSILSLRE